MKCHIFYSGGNVKFHRISVILFCFYVTCSVKCFFLNNLGYTDELTALEELVSNKQRSVNETFMRQTVRVIFLYFCLSPVVHCLHLWRIKVIHFCNYE